ncbi:hypothetical protein FOZ63_003820, partial [Perkinsus olseni]
EILSSTVEHSTQLKSTTPLRGSKPVKLPTTYAKICDTALSSMVEAVLYFIGSSNTYVVYGDWYESIYGVGSCRHLVSGCYFCPPTDPCTLDSLLTRRSHTVEFLYGHIDKFVYREVTVQVDGQNISNFLIGLLIGSSRVENGIQPNAVLGLGLPPPIVNLGLGTTSFVEQLFQKEAIPHLTISVQASEMSEGITGQLELGKEMLGARDSPSLPLADFLSTDGPLAGLASAAWVKSSSTGQNRATAPSNGGGIRTVAVDTGCDTTFVPTKIYSMIWKAIEEEFGPDRVDGTRSRKTWSTDDQQLAAFSDVGGLLWIREDVLKQMPIMVIRVDRELQFDIHLSSHVQVCDGRWCRLQIFDGLAIGLHPENLILGRFFFAEYDVSFDLDRKVIVLRRPDKP